MIKNHFNIPTIEDAKIENKRVLLRANFDVSLTKTHSIADDTRIKKSIPTIEYLLKNKNKLIIISKLNRPKERDNAHSLKHIIPDLEKYLPHYHVKLIDDFRKENPETFSSQKEEEILLLENIRFYPEEETNDKQFAKELASLADVFVMDAFAMAHRKETSVVGIPKFLPSYAGLLLEDEIQSISHVIHDPKQPIVSIVGGAKIPDKLEFLSKLIIMSDFLLVGGGIANTMLYAKGLEIGKSICEKSEYHHVQALFELAKKHKKEIVLPRDVSGIEEGHTKEIILRVDEVPSNFLIYDIGPETEGTWGNIIAMANTIIWNGPVGYFERPPFQRGTDFVYYSIAHNEHAFSLLGGGDTLSAISKEEYLDKISHISTGGGAMLEFIENGTLPGIEALEKKP